MYDKWYVSMYDMTQTCGTADLRCTQTCVTAGFCHEPCHVTSHSVKRPVCLTAKDKCAKQSHFAPNLWATCTPLHLNTPPPGCPDLKYPCRMEHS